MLYSSGTIHSAVTLLPSILTGSLLFSKNGACHCYYCTCYARTHARGVERTDNTIHSYLLPWYYRDRHTFAGAACLGASAAALARHWHTAFSHTALSAAFTYSWAACGRGGYRLRVAPHRWRWHLKLRTTPISYGLFSSGCNVPRHACLFALQPDTISVYWHAAEGRKLRNITCRWR